MVQSSVLGLGGMKDGTYHGGHAPDVGAGAPFGAEDDFWGAVLSSLNIVCEVVAYPTGIAKICYFYRYDLDRGGTTGRLG